jgi:hypothetical protein
VFRCIFFRVFSCVHHHHHNCILLSLSLTSIILAFSSQ